MEKLTDVKLAELTGTHKTTFIAWKNGHTKFESTKESRFKYDALLLGATLLQNGFTMENISKNGKLLFQRKRDKEVETLRKQVKELEDGINEYADKMEALRELRK